MLVIEKLSGNVCNTATLCRNRLDQSILLLIAVTTIIYARFESITYEQAIVFDIRFWVGLLFLITVFLSFIDSRIKTLMLGTINKIPFIIIPAMLTNLYLKNIDAVYTLYFLGTYITMLFLLNTQKTVLIYMAILGAGIAGVLLTTDAHIHNKLLILFGFVFTSGLIWIVNSGFIWNRQRLSSELNRLLQLDYLYSHKLRAPVARIKGLNQLIDMGDETARKLLKKEINSIDDELSNIQNLIYEPAKKEPKFKFSLNTFSPLEYSMIVAEIILLANVYIF